MIFLTKNQNVPKKYASIVKAIEDASSIDKVLAHAIFGSGVVNLDEASLEDNSNYTFYTLGIDGDDVYTLYFKYVGDEDVYFAFAKSGDYESIVGTITPNQFQAFYKGLDELNLIAGDSNNPVTLPLNLFYPEEVTDYSNNYYSVLYVNGTPQLDSIDNMDAITEENGNMEIGFKRIRGGVIYPEPKNVQGQFSSVPVAGDTVTSWLVDFTHTDSSGEDFFKLYFSNFKLNSTPRILIAEVYNTATLNVEYLYIPKDVAQEDTNLYYRIDDEDPTAIYVNQEYLVGLAGGDTNLIQVTFYFATPVEEVNPLTNSSALSRKYKLPFENVLPVTTDFKVFIHDNVKGTIIDAAQLSAQLVGEVYNINYETGHLELFNILPGLLNENVSVHIADMLYEPPLQLDYTGDMSNIVAAYGTKGTAFTKTPIGVAGDLPTNLFLYAYVSEKDVDFSTYSNSEAKLRTVPQLRESDVRFTISETSDLDSTEVSDTGFHYLRIGTLTRNGLTYELTELNPNFVTPYQGLLDLASSINATGDTFNVVKYEKETTITGTAEAEFTVSHVPSGATFIDIHGYLAELQAASGATNRSFSASLVLVDTTDDSESLLATITGNSSGGTYFENVPNNYKSQPFSHVAVPATAGRKYIALKMTVVTPPSDPSYDIDVNMDLYVRII